MLIPLVILIEPVKREHIVFFILTAIPHLSLIRPARLRMLPVFHVHPSMILLLLQLECLLYVESRHLDSVLDFNRIVNWLCLLLHHSLLTLDSRRRVFDQHVAAGAARVRFEVERAHVSVP